MAPHPLAPFTAKAFYTDTFCLTGLTLRPTLDPLKAALNSPAAPGVWGRCGQEQEPGWGERRGAGSTGCIWLGLVPASLPPDTGLPTHWYFHLPGQDGAVLGSPE